MDLNGKPLTAKRVILFIISLSIIVGMVLIGRGGDWSIIDAGFFGGGIGLFMMAWDVDFLKKK